MTKKRDAVEFDRLVREMAQDKLAAENWPAIVGGGCAEGELMDWLDGLDSSGMAVRIWEFSDHSTIGVEGPPDEASRLERARLFGQGGDLDIRREGNCFRWCYVGKGDGAPRGKTLEYPGTRESPVYCREEELLLWGTREEEQEQWFDDRVAGARLTYDPHPVRLAEGTRERMSIRFRAYTQAGRTLAVWLLGLERDGEGENG